MATAAGRLIGRPSRDLALWVSLIAAAWVAALWLEVSGNALLLHHHAIYHSGNLLAGGAALVLGWQVMTAAMMLPSALPMVHLFTRLSRPRPGGGRAVGLFVGAYFAVWTGFAAAAFAGDMGLHLFVHRWSWLAAHDSLVAAGVLLLAAGYQVSPWKDACLTVCRMPAPYLIQKYRPGAAGAVRVGTGHALFCLGCCWALMLVMFSVGLAHLYWMAALALVMAGEKLLPRGDRLRYPVAAALALLGLAAALGGGVLSL